MPAEKARDMRAELEARMGELAALLDDVAEALAHYPEEIEIVDDVTGASTGNTSGCVVVKASAWPTIQEIDQLLSNWRAVRRINPEPGGSPRAA